MHISNPKLSDVVKGLERATDKGIQLFIKDCRIHKNLAMLASAKRIENGIDFGRYDVTYTSVEYANVKRRYYSVISHDHGNVVFEGIALFESAVGIVRLLTQHNARLYQCNKIIDLDTKYDSNLCEAHALKYRLQQHTASDMFDIYEAKMLIARDRAHSIKRTILQMI